MPGYDGKGPEGQGPKTGRMKGRCNANVDLGETENPMVGNRRGEGGKPGVRGQRNQGQGRRGGGRGRGRG